MVERIDAEVVEIAVLSGASDGLFDVSSGGVDPSRAAKNKI